MTLGSFSIPSSFFALGRSLSAAVPSGIFCSIPMMTSDTIHVASELNLAGTPSPLPINHRTGSCIQGKFRPRFIFTLIAL